MLIKLSRNLKEKIIYKWILPNEFKEIGRFKSKSFIVANMEGYNRSVGPKNKRYVNLFFRFNERNFACHILLVVCFQCCVRGI